MKKVSVVIVNWNTKEYLKKCIVSVDEKCGREDMDVIVVDNNSSDGSAEMVRKEFLSVKLIANECNPGFGAAVNQGIRASSGECVLVMNSDLEFTNDVIGEFIGFADSEPSAGVLAPKLLNSDGTLQVSFNLFYPNLAGLLLSRLLFTSYLVNFIKENRAVKKMFYSGTKARKVAWAGGSCLFIRREVLEKAGLFDEGFFMYGEEPDLCRRISKEGYSIYYLPQAVAVHHKFKSSEKNIDRIYIEMYRSELYYFGKYYVKGTANITKTVLLWNLLLKMIILRVFKPSDKKIELSRKTVSCLKLKEPLLKIYHILRVPAILSARLYVPMRKPAADPKKIAIVRLDRMGDFILSLPVIDNIRLKYPNSRITAAVNPYLKDLAEIVKNIDNVIVIQGVVSGSVALRRERFDVAIDLLCDSNLKPAMLSFFSGSPVRVGFKGGFRELLFSHSVTPGVKKAVAALELELLEPLGIPARVKKPALQVLPGKTKDIICIHPGGNYSSQLWGDAKFTAIALRIAKELKKKVVIAGGVKENERIKSMVLLAGNMGVTAAVTGIKELVDVLSRAELLVCNNSGPLHLASAMGVPTVSTMGPSDPVLWIPVGKDHIVIRKDVECSPCSLGDCKDHKCMELITVEEMFDAVRKCLNGH